MPYPSPRLVPLLLAAACFLTACRPHPHPAPATRLVTTTSPPTARLLPARLTPANPDAPFVALDGNLPALSLLRVDVSGATVHPDYRPARFDKSAKPERTLTVRRLEYVADPLNYGVASISARLTADDARLDLTRDAAGARGLVLAGACHGQFSFHVSPKNLDHILTIAPEVGPHSPLTILRSTLSLASDDPHTLAVTLDLRARWILLPMTFSLRGRATANPADGTLTYSDLAVTGYDPGGLLAAAFLAPALDKLNGQSRPVVSFPDPRTHVTDVRFSTADGLSLTVTFGQ